MLVRSFILSHFLLALAVNFKFLFGSFFDGVIARSGEGALRDPQPPPHPPDVPRPRLPVRRQQHQGQGRGRGIQV